MTLSAWRYIHSTASGRRKWTSVRAIGRAERHDVSADLGGQRVEAMVRLRERPAERGQPWFSMTRLFVCSMKSLIGPTSCSTSRCEGTRYGGLGHDVRELEREHPQLLAAPAAKKRDGLVVMGVDHRADVGAAGAGSRGSGYGRRSSAWCRAEPRGRDVGDDDVVERHLLQRHLGMLGVGHAVGKVGMGHADGKIPSELWT